MHWKNIVVKSSQLFKNLKWKYASEQTQTQQKSPTCFLLANHNNDLCLKNQVKVEKQRKFSIFSKASTWSASGYSWLLVLGNPLRKNSTFLYKVAKSQRR